MRAGPSTVVLGVALLLGGCGRSAEEEAGRGPAAETDRVAMAKHYRFDPPAIRVPAGGEVRWVNRDDFTHSVRVEGVEHETLVVPPGEEASLAFLRPGTYPYVCTFHPHDMRGRVDVVAADGRREEEGGG